MPEPNDHTQGGGNAIDRELAAIQAILAALTGLDTEARKRVVAYVFERLGLAVPTGQRSTVTPPAAPPAAPGGPTVETPAPRVMDIRSLKEQKRPRSAMEMAAVLAYYLGELAPPSERRTEITSQDVSKYFKQASYPLPGRPRKTLFDAKSAGYFDAGSGRGAYKLNPVGYNLVAHSLPATEQAGTSNDAPRVRRKSVKRAKPGAAKKASSRMKQR
jgi:hypothetical protein